MLPDLNEWKKTTRFSMRDHGNELLVRCMPALDFNTDLHVYPTFLFQELEVLFPDGIIEEFYYRLTNEPYESESLYVSLRSSFGLFVFRFSVYHSDKEISFYHWINNQVDSQATAQHKDVMFQLYKTAKAFLEEHSPNRLFFSTQQYTIYLPEIIQSLQRKIGERYES